jgi:hypothetical protein
LEDSYIHDLYGEGAVHSEAVLAAYSSVSSPNRIVHNELQGIYGAQGRWDPADGGMSAAVAIYTHGDTWGPQSNILFERNRLRVGSGPRDAAVYCLYPGSDADFAFTRLTDSKFIDNVFVRNPQNPAGCGGDGGTISNPAYGAANCASGNQFEDGATVTIEGMAACP